MAGKHAVASLGKIGLSETYRRNVQAALPGGMIVSNDFWDALWTVLGHYLLAEQRRTHDPPTVRAKQWRRFGEQLARFKRDMIAIRRTIDRRIIDPADQPPDWWINLVWAIQEAQWRASEYSQSYQNAGAGFRRRSNPNQQRLYSEILHLWQAHFERPLTWSRGKRGKAGGPLIRFFTACVGPVLGGATPTAEGIIDIIQRERHRMTSKSRAHGVLTSRK